MKRGHTTARSRKKSAIEQFIGLPDAEKEQIARQFDSETVEQSIARSRPLNSAERRQWGRFKARAGRPKLGRGAKTISLTVERGLLQRADAYARLHGISRARLFAQSLESILGSAA